MVFKVVVLPLISPQYAGYVLSLFPEFSFKLKVKYIRDLKG